MNETVMIDTFQSSEAIFNSLCEYGTQIAFLFILSIITIFRREMSCNAVYLDGDIKSKPRSLSIEKRLASYSEWDKCKSKSCPLIELPQDVLISCLSYLHPREILNLSTVNRETHFSIHNEKMPQSLSSLLWYQIFLRDYAFVITKWKYGLDAVDRLQDMEWNCPQSIAALLGKDYGDGQITSPSMKDFYLMFGQTWVDFTIAGRTESPTLVGIHGHVFDMTTFLDEHPGSPETIITMGGGRDATSFFEAIGHSTKARSLALKRLVEIVDLSCCDDGGNQVLSGLTDKVDDSNGILPLKRTKVRVPGTLRQLRQRYHKERRLMQANARLQISTIMSQRGEIDVIGNVNIYFDPLCNCWKAWYLNLDFQPVFVHKINEVP
jgi:cytochrome b involved in lipid metabolism